MLRNPRPCTVNAAFRRILESFSFPSVARNYAAFSSEAEVPFPQKLTSGGSYPSEYDLVIVGGGLVGSFLACCLGTFPETKSLRVAVLESRRMASGNRVLPAIPDARVSAISPSTVRLFKEIGIWDSVKKARATPFTAMQVWEAGSGGYVRYDCDSAGLEQLGFIVENSVVQQALQERLHTLSSTDLISPASMASISLPPYPGAMTLEPASNSAHSNQANLPSSEPNRPLSDWASIVLNDGRMLKARLVVGADGSHSKVRGAVGMHTLTWDYDQKAVIATVQCAEHHQTAWQRFLPTGPLAVLPLHDTYSNIVWSTNSRHAEELLNLSDDEFVASLRTALTTNSFPPAPVFRPSLPFSFPFSSSATTSSSSSLPSMDFESPPVIEGVAGRRQAFPLAAAHASAYVRPRLALVGDAAHTVHPLAGQGVNMGYGDAHALTQALQACVQAGADIGSETVLLQYERKRMLENVAMVGSLHLLKSIFAVQWTPFAAARSLGLTAVNSFSFIKNRIVSFAS
mmetsp:Transcript_11655/g.18957  ORF Transcript_11655/g.18957 Transcript_11655/m.18957 type:complete len:515 (+) Transcript_11655:22-1566(+)